MGNDPSAIAKKEDEEFKFSRRKTRLDTPDTDRPKSRLDPKITIFQGFAYRPHPADFLRNARRTRANNSLIPKRLGDIVVGARIQGLNLRALLRRRRKGQLWEH